MAFIPWIHIRKLNEIYTLDSYKKIE